jgi:hypothetical protein
LIGTLTALAVISCGGGGGGNTAGGIGGTGVSAGPITGYGSIIVNGTHYDVSNTTVSIENETDNDDTDLLPGMVVTVHATQDSSGNWSADSVVYKDNLEGPVSAVDTVNNTLTVLGQTIIVDANTFFELDGDPDVDEHNADNFTTDPPPQGTANLASIIPGDMVEISGEVNATGEILATRVEVKRLVSAGACTDDDDQLEVKGTVSSLDENAQTFMVGSLTINYSAETVSGTLMDGASVEVKSQDCSGAVSGAMTADTVEVENEGLQGEDGDEAELSGFATDYDPDNSTFVVNGQLVQFSGDTDFGGGVSASDLASNPRVEVHGTLEGGVLMASEISIED